jgi:hypothetical protein
MTLANEQPVGTNHLGIPTTWRRGYWGVLQCYMSPSGKQWIRLTCHGDYYWQNGDKSGEVETVQSAIRAMAKQGFLEGEFD